MTRIVFHHNHRPRRHNPDSQRFDSTHLTQTSSMTFHHSSHASLNENHLHPSRRVYLSDMTLEPGDAARTTHHANYRDILKLSFPYSQPAFDYFIWHWPRQQRNGLMVHNDNKLRQNVRVWRYTIGITRKLASFSAKVHRNRKVRKDMKITSTFKGSTSSYRIGTLPRHGVVDIQNDALQQQKITAKLSETTTNYRKYPPTVQHRCCTRILHGTPTHPNVQFLDHSKLMNCHNGIFYYCYEPELLWSNRPQRRKITTSDGVRHICFTGTSEANVKLSENAVQRHGPHLRLWCQNANEGKLRQNVRDDLKLWSPIMASVRKNDGQKQQTRKKAVNLRIYYHATLEYCWKR